MASTGELRILTFNCSSLPVLTRNVRERLHRLADAAASLAPDIICLQEIVLRSQARLFESLLSPGRRWPFRFWAPGRPRLVAGGLALFSRLPFAEASFVPFREQGPWLDYSFLSRLIVKGMMRVTFAEPRLHLLHVHTLPDYGLAFKTRVDYALLQERQFDELVAFGRGLDGSAPLAVVGDLNAAPRNPCYRTLVRELGLGDVMPAPAGPSMVADSDFRARGVPRRQECIDHILISRPSLDGEAAYVLDQRHAFRDGSHGTLSDHRGVLARIRL